MHNTRITASMLYNFIQCTHRPTMDLFADERSRDPISPFVQLLWDRGTAYEQEVVERLTVPFVNLSQSGAAEKVRLTTEAMRNGEAFIYAGRIAHDDLLGDPDLLLRVNGGYVAGDIKSGAATEGVDEASKLKLHYGVQLALYTDILEHLGLAGPRTPFIWDIHGERVTYDLDAPLGTRNPKTIWSVYLDALASTRAIATGASTTSPAYGAICKLCHWYSECVAQLEAADDLTLLPELGRSKRDALLSAIPTVTALAHVDVAQYVTGTRTIFRGIGTDTLAKFRRRATSVDT